MPTREYLLATRNPHKTREISALLEDLDVRVRSLSEAGVPPLPGEESVEVHDSFEQNALAKASFYRRHTNLDVIADDSGLCVDALDGAPGVRSRRFAADHGIEGPDEDTANNVCLLQMLDGLPDEERGAHYTCALALVMADDAVLFTGRLHGRIAFEPRGRQGFGYDPLFLVPEYGKTVGELPPEVKASISHRANAVRSLRRWIRSTHAEEE